jgi:hypothetical protein
VHRVKPSRIVLDSLSEIRLLALSSLRYRRQLLAMKHGFTKIGATVLALDDLTLRVRYRTDYSAVRAYLSVHRLSTMSFLDGVAGWARTGLLDGSGVNRRRSFTPDRLATETPAAGGVERVGDRSCGA